MNSKDYHRPEDLIGVSRNFIRSQVPVKVEPYGI